MKLQFGIFLVLFNLLKAEDRCTTIIVGSAASDNGAPMTTHTNDCSACDFRIAKVPAMDFTAGDVREVPLVKFDFPRYVGKNRGPLFHGIDSKLKNWENGSNVTHIIGTIPQVAHTYGYVDGLYGIMNEHQLAIGESTCSGKLISKPVGHGGQALFDVTILSRLAMERTKTAREAIKLMGSLAEEFGYYGAEYEGPSALGEAGEALTVTDTKEAWVFHIHPDDTGASAVWAAQRVPDTEVAAVANQFVIGEMNLEDSDHYMASKNVVEVAVRAGFYNPEKDGEFSFKKAYSLVLQNGQHIYCTRRVWRVFTLANGKLNISPETDPLALDYPFSIKPSEKLSTQDIMRFQRDHYEGTPYDMTAGPAGGPYGNPDRYDPNPNGELTKDKIGQGHFERAISIFRASYSFVTQVAPIGTNNTNPKIWFGPYAPHATTYVPIYAKVDKVPEMYSTGSLFEYDPSTSFWSHAMVGNWVSRFYTHAIPYVKKVQSTLEMDAVDHQTQVDLQAAKILSVKGEAGLRIYLTEMSEKYGTSAHIAFTSLFNTLVTTFHDGYEMQSLDKTSLKPKSLYYPLWWLQQVGYFHENVLETPEMDHPHGIPTICIVFTLCIAAALILIGVCIGRSCGRKTKYQQIY